MVQLTLPQVCAIAGPIQIVRRCCCGVCGCVPGRISDKGTRLIQGSANRLTWNFSRLTKHRKGQVAADKPSPLTSAFGFPRVPLYIDLGKAWIVLCPAAHSGNMNAYFPP